MNIDEEKQARIAEIRIQLKLGFRTTPEFHDHNVFMHY